MFMKLIVGLGNPGRKYEDSRHNIGFIVVDELAKEFFRFPTKHLEFEREKDFKSLVCRVTDEILLAKPETFMNESGVGVAKIANFYKISPENIWVVHDDLDLLLGKMKIRLGGAGAGHHGVESIILHLGTDKFYRFRLGTGRPDNSEYLKDSSKRKEVEDYVLSPFRDQEKDELRGLIKKAVSSINVALSKGVRKAMNEYNN